MIRDRSQQAIIQNFKFKILNFWLLIGFLLAPIFISAQELPSNSELPSPRTAFLRSLVVPGWGHHYVDKTNWTRGQYHLAADVAMILSYAGLTIRGNQLESELDVYALSKANADISSRNREFQLAVATFDNLDDYNDFQLRSRNWDDLLPDIPENRWNWDEDADRFQFQDMRERVDRNNSQLPTIAALMVANRLVSALSAYNHARRVWVNAPEASFSYLNEFGQPGITANLRFNF